MDVTSSQVSESLQILEIQWGQFQVSDPFISNEASFNLTNKISFTKNDANYEIEYNVSPRGAGILQNLGPNAELKVLPEPFIKKTPAPAAAREITPKFSNLGKQNLKV